jgi:methionine synthase II (cobalamin-independent)
MRLKRTVIGSFPRLAEDDEKAFELAVALQRKYGIDLLSDGEQRGDMIVYLARTIPGLAVQGNVPKVVGKVSPPEHPEKVHKVADYFALRKKYPDLTFKVTLTGPTTLAISCGSKGLSKDYRSYVDFSLTQDIAEALKAIARPLIKARAYIQIDEPILSQGFRDLRERIGLIDYVLEGADPERCATHICGWLGRQPVLQELAKLENVSVLSHAFSALQEKENVKLLSQSLFEDSGKKLGAGVISVSPIHDYDIETPESVASRIDNIASIVGEDNIAFLHPDCGLGATRKEYVERIMHAFQTGCELYESRKGGK